jgi:hypothetical protein
VAADGVRPAVGLHPRPGPVRRRVRPPLDPAQHLPAGLTYELTSVPNVDSATVEATGPNLPPVIADHYLDLPSSYPDRFRQRANHRQRHDALRQGAGAQGWFRTSFTYDLNVAPGHA